jgi:hypothetical protein
VSSFNFRILCLTETWLNESHYNTFLPEIYTAYRSDRGCRTKLRGGGELVAVSEAVVGVKQKFKLEYFQECLYVQISVTAGRNLLIDNNYYSLDVTVDIIKRYLNCLENILDALNCHILLLGDFSVPGLDGN